MQILNQFTAKIYGKNEKDGNKSSNCHFWESKCQKIKTRDT